MRQKTTNGRPPLPQGAFDIKTRATAEAWGKKCHSCKPLPTRFRRDGFNYQQIARQGDVAIYKQSWSGCSNPSVCYERSEEHTSELQSRGHLVCRLLLEKKKNAKRRTRAQTEIRKVQ